MRFAALLLALLVLASTSVHGNTWHVPSPECPTIRAGIDAAVVGDTVLVACGTYYESDLVMKSGVTLRSESGSPDCVTIDADESSRVIRCDSVDGTALIEGLTIAHGRRPNGEKDGGGIYCTSSSPTISKCVFFENYAYSLGGGLCCSEGSSPTVIGCTFARNHAGSGGAIACTDSSSPLISNCVLGFSVGGEGVYCEGGCEPTLTCCDVFGNAKGDSICGLDGGGNFYEAPLFCDLEGGDLRLCAGSPCLPDSNTCGVLIGALSEGGCPCPDCAVLLVPDEYGTISEALAAASYCDTVVVGPGTYTEVIYIPWGVTLRSSAGSESTVIDAGGSSYGVSMGGNLLAGVDTAAVATVEGFTILGGRYSGVYARNCSPAIRNCVITGAQGSGIYLYEAGGEVYGCTVVGNADEYAGGIYCYKSPANVSNCIIAFSMGGRGILCGTPYPTFTCCNVFGNADGDYIYGIDGGGNISEDPLLCDWRMGDFAVCSLSPCLPENNTCGTLIGALGVSECDCPTYDCSVVEVPGDYETITQALAAVTFCDTVLVHPGVYEENITLPWGVTLMSSEGPDSTTIEGASSGSVVRIGYALESAPLQEIPPARFQGFTVTGGTWGGIHVRGCDPMISDCVITGNSGTYYGALDLEYANPTVTGCVIRDNGCRGIEAYASYPTITGTTISGNAGEGAGGLHYNNSHGTISNSIISFNSGEVAILCMGSSDPDFMCCDIYGNAGGDSICGTDLGGNISEDPLFCDQRGGDLRLCADSPCLPGNNSCGVLMGALGDGGCPCPTCDVLVVPYAYPTITEALAGATYCDTVLVYPGTYEEHLVLPLGVVLMSAAGPDSTVLDGGGTGTVVTISGSMNAALEAPDITTVLEGFTITGGFTRGISIGGNDPTIMNCTIVENSGKGCTGMYCYEASPVVTDCRFLRNTSTDYGCALRCVRGSPQFIGCTFSENSNTSHGYGGAVYCDIASPTFTNCVFSQNTGRYGGVIYVKQLSAPVFAGCTFSDNSGTSRGGAIYCYDRSSVAAAGCGFSGNSAGYQGGAIYGNLCPVTIDSCSFTGNSADEGGAVYCVGDSAVVFTNCTFCGSAGAPGGAVYCEDSSPSLANCIIAFGVRGEPIFCEGTSAPMVACCDVYANAGGDSICGIDEGGNFSEDPLFCDRAGGDLRLCAMSPCLPGNNDCGVLIGAGDLGECDCPSQACDVVTVPDEYPTIGEALAAASYCDTVLVYPGTYDENVVLPWGVALIGVAGPESTVIMGGPGEAVVAIGYGPESIMLLNAPRAALEGFTIMGSSERGVSVLGCNPIIRDCIVTGVSGYYGDGLHCRSASPEIHECTISDNEGYGARCESYSSPVFSSCTIAGNQTGLSCNTYSSPTVSNCTVFGNLGRGVSCDNYSAPDITGCTISGNSSSGVYCQSNSSPTLTNCILAFAFGGDGIYCGAGSEPTLRCCDIFGNAWGDSMCGADSGGNFSENPLFCDQAGGDLTLCPDSPCLPENNACGVLIGALGPGGCPCPDCTVYVVPDDFPTIGEALAVAVYCDTVLVRPGTYTEHIGLPWGVVLRSTDGAEATVIEGHGESFPVVLIGYGAIGYTSPGTSPAVLDGFTVTAGTAGGIYVVGCDPVILDCVVTGNASGYGGGISLNSSDAIVTNTRVTDNFAQSGGGLYCNGGSPRITDCEFSRNIVEANDRRRGGGGICSAGSSPVVTNCVFSDNSVRYSYFVGGVGGGILFEYSAGSLTNCTFTGNSVGYLGGAVQCVGSSPTLANCIIAFSETGSGVYCEGGSEPVLRCCDIFGNAGGDYICGADSGGNFSQDPLFCDLSGGDLRLSTSSPCLPENNDCDLLLGALGSGGCGYPGRLVLRVPDDYATIGDALAEAAYCDTVLVSPGTYDERITLPWGVVLRSSDGPEFTLIDGGGEGAVVVVGYDISDFLASTEATMLSQGLMVEEVLGQVPRPLLSDGVTPATIDGFTITGGSVAGIGVTLSNPLVIDCVVRDNSGNNGGGMYSYYGYPELSGCVLFDNSAVSGGGLYCYFSSPEVVNCTLISNTAEKGGGVYCNYSSPVLSRSVIAFSEGGEAIYCGYNSEPVVTCCDIFANAGGDEICGIDSVGNFSANPLFCNQAGGDLRLCPESQCLPANNDCGVLIGALGPGGCPCPECRILLVPGEYATIGEALAAAAYCDTVLVGPGTYPEHISLPWGVVLRGAAGAESTVIDGGGEPGPVVNVGYEESEALVSGGTPAVLDGFTITGGTDSGIRLDGASPLIASCVITGNSAENGGAVACYNSSPGFVECVFSHNSAMLSGGGVYCDRYSVPTVDACIFFGNQATSGGAIYCAWTSPEITGCTFAGNSAGRGAGVYSYYATSSPLLTRCILALNDGGEGIFCNYAPGPVVSCCNVFGNAGGDAICGVDSGGNFSANPLFCDQMYGDLRLCPDSPCLPENNDCGVLIGALGSGACLCPECTVYVVPDDYLTISEALAVASYCDTVRVGPGTYEERIAIPWGVVLESVAGPEATTIDGGGGGTVVTIGYAPQPFTGVDSSLAVLRGFTITGGTESGIRIRGSRPLITECVVTGNSSSIEGGGIRCESSSPTIIDCLISNNHADDDGGGIYFPTNSAATVSGCTFFQNTSDVDGGGIYSWSCSPIVTDCIFQGNSSRNGGGIVCYGAHPSITNCTFVSNAAEQGGGIHCYRASPNILNCIFAFAGGGGATYCRDSSSPTFACCDVFGNGGGDDICGIDSGGNFSENPLFCDQGGGDLRLCADSPCLPANNTCGVQIGALGLGGCPCPECGVLVVPGSYGTISEALAAASYCDTVVVGPGTYEENIAIPWGVSLLSTAGPESTVIDGGGLGATVSMGYAVENLAGPIDSSITVLDGFTITGGTESGIRMNQCDPVIRNCVVTRNSGTQGGGIYCYYSNPVISNCTFCRNAGESGGGLYCYHSGAEIDRSIIAFSEGGQAVQCYYTGSSITLTCSDVFGNMGGDWVGCIEGQDSLSDNFSENPLFCDEGGGDLRLCPSSQCLPDSSTCGALVGALGLGDCACTECARLLVPDEYATIKEALAAASYCDTVLVGPGTYDERIAIPSGVVLMSVAGSDATVIDGGGEGTVVSIGVPVGEIAAPADSSLAVLDGFTITGGTESGIRMRYSEAVLHDCVITGNTGVQGAGVYCYRSSLTLDECEISANEATNDAGAIYCTDYSSLTAADCMIFGNVSAVDGGICCYNHSTMDLTGCTVSGNVTGNDGGAVDSYSYCSLMLTDCVLGGNSVARYGGAVFGGDYCTLEMTGCTVVENSTPDFGGGVYLRRCIATITGCTFSGNSGGTASGFYCRYLSEVALDRTIIAFGQDGSAICCEDGGSTASLTCCDVYGNQGGDWVGCIGGQGGINDNSSSDPLFCDAAAGDYHLRADSPCAPDNSPGSCGLIGSQGVGCQAEFFIRGDDDGDGELTISDPILSLCAQFASCNLTCMDASDADDNGEVNISDPIYNLAAQFSSGPPPPAPFPACGEDPTADGLTCACHDGCMGCGQSLPESEGEVTMWLGSPERAGNLRFAYPVYLSTVEALWGFEYTVAYNADDLVFQGLDKDGTASRTHDFSGAVVAEAGETMREVRLGDIVSFDLSRSLAPGIHEVGRLVFRKLTSGEPASPDIVKGKYVKIGPSVGDIVTGTQTGAPDDGLFEAVPITVIPNPTTGRTSIRFGVPKSGPLNVSIYSVTGQLVCTLADRHESAGRYEVSWDGRNSLDRIVPDGIYFCRVTTSGTQEIAKIILLR